jgi:hypothetical protein
MLILISVCSARVTPGRSPVGAHLAIQAEYFGKQN